MSSSKHDLSVSSKSSGSPIRKKPTLGKGDNDDDDDGYDATEGEGHDDGDDDAKEGDGEDIDIQNMHDSVTTGSVSSANTTNR